MKFLGREPSEEQIKISKELTEVRDKLIDSGYIMDDIKPLRCKDESIISAISCLVDKDDYTGEEVILDKIGTFYRLTVELRDKGVAFFSTSSAEEVIKKFEETMQELREQAKE